MTRQEQKLKKQNEKPKTIKTKNPATEEILNEYDILTEEQINEAAKKAKDTFQRWSTMSLEKRTGFLHDFAAQLRKTKDHLARTATLEMGKAIKEARSEVEKCAWAIEYFADNGKEFSNDEIINTDARKSSVTFQPIGSKEGNAVTFTGCLSAGAKVAQRATSQIKKCVLELGGSDPFIVCDDAD